MRVLLRGGLTVARSCKLAGRFSGNSYNFHFARCARKGCCNLSLCAGREVRRASKNQCNHIRDCVSCASVCMCLLLFASVCIALLVKKSLAMAAAYGRRRPAFFLVERKSLAMAISYERRWRVFFLVERNSLAMTIAYERRWPAFFLVERKSLAMKKHRNCTGFFMFSD